MRRFPDDIITIILSEMNLEENPLKFDRDIFYNVIYKHFRQHPNIFSDFCFIESGTYPYSELLERIINRHKISRLLKLENPDFEIIRLKEGTTELVERKLKPNFGKDELEILKNIGKELQERLSSL